MKRIVLAVIAFAGLAILASTVLLRYTRKQARQTKEAPKPPWFVQEVDLPAYKVLLQHNGNLYRLVCRESYRILKDSDVPTQKRAKPQTCGSIIAPYVGKWIATDAPDATIQSDKDGWFATISVQRDGGLALERDNIRRNSSVWYQETYGILDVEPIEAKQ